MVDRSINPDEHQTTTTTSTTSRAPVDWLIMTLRVVQNPDNRQVNDASSHPSSSSNTADRQLENLVDRKHHNPTASHLDAAQTNEGVSTGAVWEFNTGENTNKKGQQRGGNIKAGNTVTGSSTGISFPQNGRFVFNTGKNINEGDVQETGNVFSNSH